MSHLQQLKLDKKNWITWAYTYSIQYIFNISHLVVKTEIWKSYPGLISQKVKQFEVSTFVF